MPKKILLIESDAAFAQEMATAIEARGLQARITGDGREGLELAKVDRPDAVVLCVELPRMSGYSVCQKFKKDNRLREIPLVLMSAEATRDTFEQHRKLKARADEYLLKPFDAAALLRVVGGLVQLPPAAESDAAEDVVTLEDVEELDAVAASPETAANPPFGVARGSADDDEDLRLLDEAFDHLASAPDLIATQGIANAGSSAADAPVDADKLARTDATLAVGAAIEGGMHRESDRPDGQLAEVDAALAAIGAPSGDEERSALLEADAAPYAVDAPGRRSERNGFAELDAALAAADIIAPPPPGSDDGSAQARSELQTLNDRVSALHIQLARTEEELQHVLAELAAAHASAESAAREHVRRADESQARLAQAEAARAEAEQRGVQLQKRVAELEALNARHEERVVKAYQKIKGDEKVREKTRKALVIALQLLEERAPGAPSPDVQPRRE